MKIQKYFFVLLVGLFGGSLLFAQIHWHKDLNKALQKAQKEKKMVLIEFMATWCPVCRAMEDSTFSHPEVIERMKTLIPVRIDVDKQRKVAETYHANARKYGGVGIPNVLFLDSEGKVLLHRIGFFNAKAFVALLDSVKIEYSKAEK